jgi:hypothetical protein
VRSRCTTPNSDSRPEKPRIVSGTVVNDTVVRFGNTH